MATKTLLTKEGKEKLELELRDLIDNKRDENITQLSEARAQGDLSENADYDAARDKQAEIEARIKQIQNILNNCEIITQGPRSHKRVGLGSTVTFENLESHKIDRFMIVGTVESDPFNGKISNDSPLGMALMGKEADSVIEVKAKKPYQIKILKIEIL